MSPLSEAIRVGKNKANFNLRFGRPEDGDYTGAEAFLQAQQEAAPAVARSSGPGTSPGSMPPATAFPGGNVLAMRRQAAQQILRPPTLPGAVPAGIMDANPEAYFDPRSGSTVIGASGRNRNAIGGNTWSGNAMKNGQVMQNTNMASFGMPGPNERRGTIGGRGTPAAPDMFGRQFDKPTGPAPMGTTVSGGQSHAPKAWGIPGYAEGGEVDGPGGPKDDLIPAMLSDGEFIIPADAVRRIGTDRLEKMIEPPDMEKKKPKAPPSMHGGMMHMAAGGFVNPGTLDAISQSASHARMNDGLSPVPFGPTMNDHPAFQPQQPMATGFQVPVMQSSPIPAQAPVMQPMLDPQPPAATFAPRMVGGPVPSAPPPLNSSSPTPFLAPWEKDAARAAAADAASGRPEGVRKSDWRKFQRTPQGMMFNIQRQDQAAQDAQRERVRLDEQAVAVNRDLFRTNTGIQMDAMNRAASTQAAADARAVEENYRMAAENRKIGNEAAMRSAENNAPPQDIPGTDYVRTAYGNLPKTRPAPTTPPGMVPKSMTVGGVRYEVPEGDKPAGPLKIRAKLQPKGDFEMVQWSDGLILPSPRNISPTAKQKEEAYKAVTGQDLDSKNAEHWSDAYYFARGERPPKWTQTAAAPAKAAPAANEKAASLRSKYGY